MEPRYTGNTTTAKQLLQARLATGLSTRDVASKLADALRVSHATIANYERGRSVPPFPILAALADLYGKPLVWFLQSGPELTGIRYRYRKSKLRRGVQKWFEANTVRWLEAYARLEQRLNRPLKRTVDLTPNPDEPAREFAQRLRKMMKVRDADPISSVVEILENFGIRTIELPTELPIDGLAASFGQEFAVVMNPNTSNDRCRMICGHELSHVAYGDCAGGCVVDDKATEKRAFEMASHFILPESQLQDAFRGQSMVRLVQFKERFGISLAAMVYRAQQTGIINESTSKWLWIEFTRRGWRTQEPGHVRPDRATRFEQLLDSAITEGKLSWSDTATLTGVREEELRERLRLALGHADIEDRGEEDDTDDHVLPFPH